MFIVLLRNSPISFESMPGRYFFQVTYGINWRNTLQQIWHEEKWEESEGARLFAPAWLKMAKNFDNRCYTTSTLKAFHCRMALRFKASRWWADVLFCEIEPIINLIVPRWFHTTASTHA